MDIGKLAIFNDKAEGKYVVVMVTNIKKDEDKGFYKITAEPLEKTLYYREVVAPDFCFLDAGKLVDIIFG